MCDNCYNISRRRVLKMSAAGLAAAALTACQTAPVTEDLPEPYTDHLIEEGSAESGPPVHIDPAKIIVPPPQPPQHTEYGEIMPRSSWTHVPLQLSDGRPMEGVNRLTVHHSGDGKPFLGVTVADVARHLQIVQQAHLQRGMIDIAYHFAIDRSGRAWQLRWLKYEGQHVRMSKSGFRWNEHNIGIVMLGDFNLQYPSQLQFSRLGSLVRTVRQKYALPASRISMHEELVQTDCPGKRLVPLISIARRQGQM